MGFTKKKLEKKAGLGQDLVTTGARTNALYQEAKMREHKKKMAKQQEDSRAQGATFQPKLFTKASSRKMSSSGNDKDVADRLYKHGGARQPPGRPRRWDSSRASAAPRVQPRPPTRGCLTPLAAPAAAEVKAKKLAQKRDQELFKDTDTFTPDISASQNNCEAASLGNARHMALFMQGEIVRAKQVLGPGSRAPSPAGSG